MKKILIIGGILIVLAVLLNIATAQPISPFVIRFLDLIDVAETSFTGEAGEYVRVNAGETGLEFVTLAGGGDFLADGSVPMTDALDMFDAAAPTTNATGEISLDTTIVDHQPLFQYYDGGENMTVIAIDTAQLPALDNEIVKYDAASDKFVLEADAGGGGNDVYVEEGDVAKVDSTGADLYIDFDGTNFDVGVVGNEGNISIAAGGVALADLAVAAYAIDLVATSPMLVDGGVNVDNILVGADADVTISATIAKDIVATSPLTVNAGANLDNVIIGTDADITIAIADADDDGATKGAASFDNTDFDAAGGNVTIVNDGHTHTGASVSGIGDGQVDNNITIDLATLATTVTLGDDDATNDNQDIIFTTDAAGPVNLEADIGDFHYNPSTGTCTATQFSGGGAGLTGTVTAYDDIADPDAASSITFQDGETVTWATQEDSAGSFFLIQDSDAALAANTYLLDLDYSVDDNEANADYFRCQDAGGVVFSIQQDGDTATTGDITGNKLELTGGNITYLDIGDNIETAIAAATAGDTIVLAAGTYTVIDDIDIAQAITVRGQGRDSTTILTVTDTKNVFHITADNVHIKDLFIDVTADGTKGVHVDATGGNIFSNVTLENVDVTLASHAGVQNAVYYVDAGGLMRNCEISATSADDTAVAVELTNVGTAEAVTYLYVYDSRMSASAGANNSIGAYSNDNAATQDCRLYLYYCYVLATEGAACSSYGGAANNGDAALYGYYSYFSATDYDVRNNAAIAVDIRACTLYNNTTSGTITRGGTINTAGLVATGTVLANGNLEVGNAAASAGVLTIHEDTDEAGAEFASFTVPALAASTVYILPPDDGDNTEVLQTNGAGTLTWVANAGGGATAWDDISDPDNGAATTITFDNAETTIFTGDNDAAASFVTIQNTDGDHTVGQLYLLDLDYSADDGDAEADFIRCQDSGGDVFTVGQDGELAMDGGATIGGSLEAATITEGLVGVPNLNEIDWINADEMANADHGDVAWSGGDASVEACTIADTVYASCYVGLFQAATGADEPFYTDGGLTYDATSGTLSSTILTEGGLAVYNSGEIPSGSLGGTYANITIDDLFIKLGGDVASAGDYDFGEANVDLELPQTSPAVPAVDGQVELDFTDGTVVIQHGSAHAELGSSTDVVVGKLIHSFSGTIFEPDGVNDVLTVKAINSIEFPHGIVVTAVYLGVSSDDGYVLTVQNFDDFDTINGAQPTIDTVTYPADATGEIIDSTPVFATIAAGQIIMISIPATDVAWIHFEIYFYEPAA